MASVGIARRLIALALLAVLPACGAGSHQSSGAAASMADRVTQAVYADNAKGVASSLDRQLRPHVTRAEVGLLSDKMHALGSYKGLTFMSGDPSKSEFIYRAAFDKGSMNVAVRIDPNGRLAAYRVYPSKG